MIGEPSLPTVWRPRLGRVIPYVLAVSVLVCGEFLAFELPSSDPVMGGVTGRVVFGVLGALIAAVLCVLARCRIAADERGLTIVNMLRVHRLEWAEVIDAAMAEGDPWPTLDLANGTTLATMGIQSADGSYAWRAYAELRTLLEHRSAAPEPGD